MPSLVFPRDQVSHLMEHPSVLRAARLSSSSASCCQAESERAGSQDSGYSAWWGMLETELFCCLRREIHPENLHGDTTEVLECPGF